MKECDKRNSHINSKHHVIYISSNNIRHPVTKTFTTFHPTTLHSTSLHLSTLHFLSFKLHPTTLHLTSLHFTSHHYTSLKFRHFYSFHITHLHLLPSLFFKKYLDLQWKVPNVSAGSWLQWQYNINSAYVV